MTGKLQIHQFNCRDDNFCVLVHDPNSGATAAIDAPDREKIEEALVHTGWALTDILTTHHHFDHTEGNLALKEKYGCTVTGPRDEADKVPGIDVAVSHGETFMLGTRKVDVIGTPGHTLGEISFHFADDEVVFAGDTLFALGCGRVFEGNAPMMWQSLCRLAALPPQTTVYCGHEYTLANARFAITVDPQNTELAERLRQIEGLRAQGKPTLPTTIGLELKTNPFLRPSDPSIRAHLNMEDATDSAVFAEIRARKDRG